YVIAGHVFLWSHVCRKRQGSMKLHSVLKLPREHGAWAMLYVSFVLGVVVAGRVWLPVWLLLLAATGMFGARGSLVVWWRARNRGRPTRQSNQAAILLAVYSAIVVASGGPLIAVYKLYWLLPLALLGVALLVINGRQATEFEDRTIQSEMTAIVGITMTA